MFPLEFVALSACMNYYLLPVCLGGEGEREEDRGEKRGREERREREGD